MARILASIVVLSTLLTSVFTYGQDMSVQTDLNLYYNAEKQDYSNDRVNSSEYYNAENNDMSNFKGQADSQYSPDDSLRLPVYGDPNTYKNSDGVLINKQGTLYAD